jgi:hypothetical protein
MQPEIAMEKYMTLLSETIPGWTGNETSVIYYCYTYFLAFLFTVNWRRVLKGLIVYVCHALGHKET